MCIFLLQPDPAKVESVQDVLARAAAKGLLGGIVPEESKKGKKREKRRKDREDPPESKPSSPSSYDGETGNEFEDGQDTVHATGHDEKRGGDEPERGNEGKKRGTKGRKIKVKRRPKRSTSVSKLPKDNRKAAKKKPQSQHSRRLRRRRARKIPRLTLTLISSAKASGSLSSMAALAHKLSKNVAIEPQPTPEFSPRPRASRPDSSPRLPAATRRPDADAGRAEETLTGVKAGTSKTRAKMAGPEAQVTTRVGSEATDLVLPPISGPPRSRGGSSVSRRHSRASRSKTSASSSASLLGL